MVWIKNEETFQLVSQVVSILIKKTQKNWRLEQFSEFSMKKTDAEPIVVKAVNSAQEAKVRGLEF